MGSHFVLGEEEEELVLKPSEVILFLGRRRSTLLSNWEMKSIWWRRAEWMS